MEAIQSALSSRRFTRLLFWLGVAVLAAGIVVLLVKLAGGSDKTSTSPDKGFKPQLPAKTFALKNAQGVTVTSYSQLDPGVKLAIRKFILDAVAGKNYAESWKYIAPSMRKGYTLKSWANADAHPIIPFPVYRFDESKFQLTEATTKEVLVDLKLAAKPSAKLKPTRFRIGLAPVGSGDQRWLVTYWMPVWTPLLPLN
jgi:hypothetical protein